MNNSTLDWDNLRYFLAVARRGSTLAAAKELQVSQSTVHRRLDELERYLGRQLAKRHPTGYRLTALGQDMKAHAERVEAAVDQMNRRLAASDSELTGSVRLTCPEAFGSRLLNSSLLDEFKRLYPELKVEILIGESILDLGKGQADIAIRANAQAEKSLFGRKLGDVAWALYAAQTYVRKHGQVKVIDDLDRHSIVLFDGELRDHPASVWLKSVAPNAKVVARSKNLPTLLLAVSSGAGIGPMPTTIESRDNTLVRVLDPIPELSHPLHMLVHKDMRNTPRVRALFNFIAQHSRQVRQLLGGVTDTRFIA